MEASEIVLLSVALLLGFFAYHLSYHMEWHWGVGGFLALVPLAATFFLGIFGLLGSAVFVGSLYRASSS
ncbi:MAG TPA: hypothetical protein VLM40_08410 [Gemmata sp.]|nr:hypothetical protein [Gemmata sp.]